MYCFRILFIGYNNYHQRVNRDFIAIFMKLKKKNNNKYLFINIKITKNWPQDFNTM